MSGTRVDFYLDFISPYAFFALDRIRSTASPEAIDWQVRPVVYAKLLEAHGLVGPVETQAKRRYTMLDLVRIAEHRGIELVGPPAHPFRSLASLRALLLFAGTEHALPVAYAISRAAWVEGLDLEDWSVLETCVISAGANADTLEQRATAPENKVRLIESTASAIERGVFGVPSFELNGELFWGHDRLNTLFERLDGTRPSPNAKTVEKLLSRPIGVRRPTN